MLLLYYLCVSVLMWLSGILPRCLRPYVRRAALRLYVEYNRTTPTARCALELFISSPRRHLQGLQRETLLSEVNSFQAETTTTYLTPHVRLVKTPHPKTWLLWCVFCGEETMPANDFVVVLHFALLSRANLVYVTSAAGCPWGVREAEEVVTHWAAFISSHKNTSGPLGCGYLLGGSGAMAHVMARCLREWITTTAHEGSENHNNIQVMVPAAIFLVDPFFGFAELSEELSLQPLLAPAAQHDYAFFPPMYVLNSSSRAQEEEETFLTYFQMCGGSAVISDSHKHACSWLHRQQEVLHISDSGLYLNRTVTPVQVVKKGVTRRFHSVSSKQLSETNLRKESDSKSYMPSRASSRESESPSADLLT